MEEQEDSGCEGKEKSLRRTLKNENKRNGT